MKKKIQFGVLVVVLALGLVGCGSKGDTDDDTVVSTGSGVGLVEATAEPTEEALSQATEAPTLEPEAGAETEVDSELKTESNELTGEELKSIVHVAMQQTGDYKAQCVLTHWLYVHDREQSAFDMDYTLSKEVLFDDEKQASYSKGTWENNVINTWTGTTSSGEEEGYYAPGEYDGKDMIISYFTGYGGTWYLGCEYVDYNNITTYYNSKANFELVEENETEYIIRSYLPYVYIKQIVNDYSIDDRTEFPVTYRINKETKKLQHIQWKLEYVDISDLMIEMNMDITPMEDISVEVPADVIANCVDTRI